MVDLGLFNFIKNALAHGKSKEEIYASLANGHWSRENIDQAFTSVERGEAPNIPRSDVSVYARGPILPERSDRPAVITALCGYFFFSWFKTIFTIIATGALFISIGTAADFTINTGVVLTYIAVVGSVIGIIGFWFMRKWGAIIYTLGVSPLIAYVLINMRATPVIYWAGLVEFIIPVITIIIGLRYFVRMK